MKLIKDLGVVQSGNTRRSCGMFECSDCKVHIKMSFSEYKRRKTSRCNSCKHNILYNITHGETKTRLYSIWSGIKQRCFNPNTTGYEYYGGRGITICEEWSDNYEFFRSWANSNGYSKELTIDRTNNDGNYEPSNCAWVDLSHQAQTSRVIKSTNKSGYKGVSWRENRKYWIANIMVDKINKYLGSSKDAKVCAKMYNDYVELNNLNHTKNTV